MIPTEKHRNSQAAKVPWSRWPPATISSPEQWKKRWVDGNHSPGFRGKLWKTYAQKGWNQQVDWFWLWIIFSPKVRISWGIAGRSVRILQESSRVDFPGNQTYPMYNWGDANGVCEPLTILGMILQAWLQSNVYLVVETIHFPGNSTFPRSNSTFLLMKLSPFWGQNMVTQ